MLSITDILDYILHHSEHKTLGQSGERFLYRELQRHGVSRKQMFRNVYIPAFTEDGWPNDKTTEIDLLVISQKGLLVFEHKAYSGKIYGDGHNKQWVQYLGNKKNFFLSPVEQNRYHRFCLQKFLGTSIPIYTFITHSQCGNWKVRNLPENAHFLNARGSFRRFYNQLPPATIPQTMIDALQQKFRVLSRPTDGTREEHIVNFLHKP